MPFDHKEVMEFGVCNFIMDKVHTRLVEVLQEMAGWVLWFVV
jgi:hypothetical protein